MAKKATITPVTDTVNNASAINTQLNAINNQLANTLSLDGSTPNAMNADVDMNSNDILNAGNVAGTSFTINGVAITAAAATSAASAADSAASAALSASNVDIDQGVSTTSSPSFVEVNLPPTTNADHPYLNVSDIAELSKPKNHVFIRQQTASRGDAVTLQLQRLVTTDDGHVNPKGIKALTQITAGGGDQIEWAISGEVENSDNTRTGAEGGTGVSGVALKKAANTGVMFGGHFQVKDETGAATVGGIVGVEANIQGNGPDTNANRIGFDLIARTYLSGTAGEFTAGMRIRNSGTVDGGKWTTALVIQDGTQATPNGIAISNSPGTGLGVGISDAGSKAIGIRLDGTYGSAALRIGSSQYIAMEATSAIKTGYGVTANVWGFYNGATERVGFDMTAAPALRIAGTTVVNTRKTGWGGATGTATRTTFATGTVTTAQLAERVKALIDDLTTHGMIGA